ncbi:MAG: hypothetical protein ACTHV2_05125 [Brachybacterium sp.]
MTRLLDGLLAAGLAHCATTGEEAPQQGVDGVVVGDLLEAAQAGVGAGRLAAGEGVSIVLVVSSEVLMVRVVVVGLRVSRVR